MRREVYPDRYGVFVTEKETFVDATVEFLVKDLLPAFDYAEPLNLRLVYPPPLLGASHETP